MKGPYRLWVHKHTFSPHEDGVLMVDELEYDLPLSILGVLAHSLYVKKRLNEIFDFRYEKVEAIFNSKRVDDAQKAISL